VLRGGGDEISDTARYFLRAKVTEFKPIGSEVVIAGAVHELLII